MSVQEIQVGFGKCNFPVTLTTLTCFRVKAPFIRDSAASSGRSIRGAYREYLAGAVPDFGVLYSKGVEHNQGEVILLQSGWKRRGASIRDAAVFLRLRDGAAKWRIEAKLPTEVQNQYGGQFSVFDGFADVMSLDDLSAAGFEVPRHYREKFMSEEEVDECFLLSQMLPERLARPGLMVVRDGGKEKVVEVASAPARRIVFRGGK